MGGVSYNTKDGMNTSGVQTTESSQSQDSFPDAAVSAAASEDGFLPWIAEGAKCCERRKASLGLLGGSGGLVRIQSLYSISRCYKYQNLIIVSCSILIVLCITGPTTLQAGKRFRVEHFCDKI